MQKQLRLLYTFHRELLISVWKITSYCHTEDWLVSSTNDNQLKYYITCMNKSTESWLIPKFMKMSKQDFSWPFFHFLHPALELWTNCFVKNFKFYETLKLLSDFSHHVTKIRGISSWCQPRGYESFRILKKGALTNHFKCFAPHQFRTHWVLDKKTLENWVFKCCRRCWAHSSVSSQFDLTTDSCSLVW